MLEAAGDGVDAGNDGVAAGDGEGAAGEEVPLHVDDQQSVIRGGGPERHAFKRTILCKGRYGEVPRAECLAAADGQDPKIHAVHPTMDPAGFDLERRRRTPVSGWTKMEEEDATSEGLGSGLVKVIESPRDAWQSLPKVIEPEVKSEYLRALISAGFRHLDAVGFISREAVPQMADSELVLEYLDAPAEVEMIGLVANGRGAERALKSGRVTTLAFPYSISPQFLERNQRQTPEDALDEMEKIGELAYKHGQDVVAYVAMAFGNPFGDAWDVDEVVSAVDLLVDLGVAQVSLSDTTGMASAELVRDVVRLVLDVHQGLEVGVHLRARPEDAAAKVRAAYEAGCRRFDATMGGLGVCAYAQDIKVGNVATEALLAVLRELDAEMPEMEAVDPLVGMSLELQRRYGAPRQ